MAARYRYVIGYSHIGFLASAHFDLLLVLCIDYVEYFLIGLLSVRSGRVDGFKNNVIFLGFVNVNDINQSIFMSNSKREVLLAQLAV